MSRSKTRTASPAPLVEELEPRLLLSAGIEAALFADAANAGLMLTDQMLPPVVAAPSTNAAATDSVRHELVFVDAATPDAERFIAQLENAGGDGRELEIILLDSAGDAVAQISQALMARGDLDAIHIVSHGSDGALQLGGERIDAAALERLAGTLRGWGDALDADADILLYGCNLGATQSGHAFVARLAQLTGADVAASDDMTGHAALGGDWDLEIRRGVIDANVVADAQVQKAWMGTLVTSTFQEGSGGYASTQDTYIDQQFPATSQGTNVVFSVDLESSGSNTEQQALIRFDNIFGGGAGQIPLGATIVSASLTIEGIDDAGGANIELYRMLQSWSESDTWTSRVNGIQTDGVEAATTADSVIVSPSPGSYTFTGLAATLQAWSNGDANHGWAVLNDNTAGWDIASSENPTSGFRPSLVVNWLPGTEVISGTVSEDVDGDGNLGDAVGAASVDVDLYLDDGDGVIDAGDTLAASTTTDGSGDYSFTGLSDGTYWVVVDSTTIAASAGYNSGFADADVWADQTYGSAGAVSFDGSYSYLGAAGALYGGLQAEVADDASALTSAEHVTRVVIAGADATGVDSAFSFNVITRTGDGDVGPGNRTLQGSLRQFVGNSNAIAGTQSSLFVINTADSNYNGSGNGEYTINLTTGWDAYLTDTVIMDATTQAGYSGTPIIELDVSGAGSVTAGFAVRANNSTVRGFIVHGSADEGIEVDGSTGFGDNNIVQNNWIGLNASGAMIGNGDNGFLFAVDAVGNLFGGTGANDGNIVVGSTSAGVLIRNTGTDNNVVEGNYIGVGPDGATAMPNVRGVEIALGATNNRVGGATATARNVISGNNDHGVVIWDAATQFNTIAGNYIGVDASGTLPVGNQFDGIYVGGDASNNTIGGSAPGEGNVISGNLGDGIEIGNSNTTGNSILGNRIGTNAAGTGPIANGRHGVVIYNGANNTQIGGAGASEGNLISGNVDSGIVIDGALGGTTTNNVVQGNRIGTDAAGTAAIANGSDGIEIFGGANNTQIGGSGAGEGNLISGNDANGIDMTGTGTNGNVIQGNFIGTDVSGTVALGNGNFGLWIFSSADNNTVGGSVAGEGNVIGGHGGFGVAITSADGTTVQGNFIGTDTSGTIDLGNSLSGVAVQGNSANTDVGGVNPGEGNVIANNDGAGVLIGPSAGLGNSILGNSIFGNAQLGIDIVEAGSITGVTANDPLDADGGANNQQNFPLLISSNTDESGNVYVAGTMNAAVSTTYRVEFFATPTADASGYGQGAIYLGFANITTDAGGKARFSTVLGSTLPAGYVLSTTATAPDGSTSEFSAVVDANRMGVLVVDTTLDSVDGNVTSIAALLSNRGADERISLREAILATNATANAGMPDEIHFNLQLDDPNRFYYQDDGSGGSLSLVATTTLADADIGDFDPDYLAAPASWFRFQPTSALPSIDQALIIDGFTQDGASANTLAIGSDAVMKIVIDGALSGNVDAFVINAPGSAIHGLTITGDFLTAIVVNAANVDISGNYIGTDATGSMAGASLDVGIALQPGAINSTVGGALPSARNVISGMSQYAIMLTGATTHGNTIEGNYVGTTAQGDSAITGASKGVILLQGTYDNVIRGNLISGNSTGIEIDGDVLAPTNNSLVGNLIGTDATGGIALANGVGILLRRGATNTTIGGTSAADRNVISGNTTRGIRIDGAGTSGHVIIGNFIGTDISGTVPLGNGDSGIRIGSTASGNTIGGSAPGEGNVISANLIGIHLVDASANVVQGNLIGTDNSGTADLGNLSAGVHIQDNASGNTVGGTTAAASNVIAHSGGAGVLVFSDAGTGNAILGNAIYDSTGLGIEHQPGGLVPPDLTSAETDGAGNVTVVGSIDALPSTTYRIEFFANSVGDPGGSGEGEVYLGFVDVTTDGAGRGDFTAPLAAVVAPGAVISATSTDASNNTSEFAVNIVATQTAPAIDLDADDSSGQGGADYATAFVEDGGPVTIADLDATVVDPDSMIDWMTVTITNPLDGALETLAANTGATGIVASYNAGTGVLTLSGTTSAANYQQVLRTITYDNSSDAPDVTARVLQFVAHDGISFSNVATTTLAITATNDAPVLTPVSPSLPGITEDDVNNGGIQVSMLLGGSVSDPDNGAVEGIAIVSLFSSNGTWQYSLDAGTSWLDVGAVSVNSALLLRSTDYVRFVPDAENADSANFGFRAWDQTTGTAGGLGDTTLNGGQTAYSSTFDAASITVTAVNDAPVLTPAAPSLPTITEDDVANGGQQVSVLLGASVSDVDTGAVEGIAVTGLTSGNGTWQYSLDGGASWLNVGAVANNSALLLRATDFIRFVPDAENADSASITYRAWDRTSGSAGTLADTSTNGNQSPFSVATDTASITVTAVNDAPVLAPVAPSLPTITEDDVANAGQQVSVLLGASVSDVDSGAVEGIAITSLSSGNGTWQYSLDGGTSWLNVGAVANNSALLLRATDFIRFVPDDENADSASFTYRAWDQSSGSAGTLADTSTNGNQSTFSTLTDTASIIITAVNDAPVLTPATPSLPTITEDELSNSGEQVSVLLGASVSDVDPGAVEGIAITGLSSGNGTWQYSLDGGTSWLNVGAVANNSALLLRATDFLRFVPDGENADSASITYRAWDQSAGAAGTLADTSTNGNQSPFSVATDSASITVTAVNDAPVIVGLSGDSTTYTAGDGAILVEQGGDVLVSDVDSADFDTGDLTVSFLAGSDPAEDVLSIRDQGTGAGQIGFDGTSVTYGGVLIATASGGSAGADLAIVFNANATTTAVAALIENITYENTDTVDPTTGARAVRFELRDGDGGAGASYDTTVNLPGVNTATILDRFGIDAYSNNDGTENWSANWIEVDSSGGGATGGRIEVRSGRLDFQVANAGNNIYREANLANAISATLSFNYDNALGNSATLHVEVSGDGGASYTTVAIFDASTNTGTGNQSIDISAFTDTNTRVRFYVVSGETGSGVNGFWADNVQIEYTYNTDPVVTLPGAAVNYTENDGAVVIDSLATVADAESADFDGGVLTVDFTAGGTANDRLSVRDQGTGIGQVGVSGTDVTYAGVIVGTFSGGIDGSTPLTITFNTSADQAAVQAIARNITYENVSDDPSTTARTVRFVLTDGDGGTSVAASETITLTATNDAPVLTPASPSLPAITEDDIVNSGVQVSTLLGGSVSDVDGGAVEGIAITGLSSGNGAWQYSLDGGTSWLDVGAVANNSALLLRATDFLRFVPDGENADSASFTYRAWDRTGGSAGALADTSTNGNQSPFSAATDSASITVTAVNDAPVLTPAAPSLPTITEDDLTNGGEQVSVLLGGTVSDVDSGALEGIAITSLSSGNGTWQYSIDGGASWLNVGAVANNSALLLRATDFVRFVPDGENADSASFTYRAWDQSSGSAGTLADTSTNGNQSPFSAATDNASITITAVNDAPVLTPAAPSLPTITEDDLTNGGEQVSVLLGGSAADVDTGALEGIAITGLTSGNGTWQYSLDGGASWLNVGAVANNSALLLRATDFLRFVPDGENTDSASFTYRAWDQSTGSAGTLADTTTNGNQSPFSTLTDTASITITAVNDAPVLTPTAPSLPTITEDDVANGGRQISMLLGGSVSDVDAGAIEGIAITSLSSGNGNWQYSLDGGTSWLNVGAVANNSALLLRATDYIRFVPDGENADSASITYRAWDLTSGSAGALADTSTNGNQSPFSATTDTASITVTAVNDAPVLTPAAPSLPTITEDNLASVGQQVSALLGGSVSDVDAGAIEGIAITTVSSGNGTWQYSLDGGASWLNVGAVANNSALLLRATDFIRFVPDGENADSASVTYRAWDRTSGSAGTLADTTINGNQSPFSAAVDTASITVTAINDAPVLTPAAPSLPTITEDAVANSGQQISVLLGGSVSDVDSGALEGIAITGLLSGNGTWQYSLDGGTSWLNVGAVANNSALLLRATDFLRFVPDGENADSASVTYRAWDQSSGSAGALADTSVNGNQSPFSTTTDTASITVTAVNDAPVLTPAAPALPTITEDNVANGGQQISTLLGASVSDVDTGAIEGIAITGLLSGNGTWQYSLDGGASWLNVGAVANNSALLLRATDFIRFVPDGENADSASFTYRAWDQSSGTAGALADTSTNGNQSPFSTATDSAAITVTAVNDAPVLTPATPSLPTITENDVTNGGQQISVLLGGSVSDVDIGALEGIAITGLASGNGTWQYSLDGGTSWFNVGAVANNSALLLRSTDFIRFVPDGENADSASFTYRAWDRTGGSAGALADTSTNGNQSPFSAATDSASITVTAVNDAPVLTPAAPSLPTITEDDLTNGGEPVSVLLGGSVADVDTGALEGIAITGLTSGNGTWQYSLDGGASWLNVGAVANNSALLLRSTDFIRFVPDGENADSASFTYRAWDQSSGTAGALADTSTNGNQSPFSAALDTASINVTAVNDAPVLTPATPSLPTITENDVTNGGQQIGVLLGGSVTDVDAGAIEGIAITSLSSGNGTWQYSLDGGASWLNVGAVANNSALLLRSTDFLRFVPDGQNADSASITYRAWDRTSGVAGTTTDTTLNGGANAFSTTTDTASITVTAVNDAPVNNFTGQPQRLAGAGVDGATDVEAADLDGDGDIDLIAASWTDGRVTWFENDGTGSFTEHTIATGVSGARHVYIADINNDSHLDVLVSDYINDTVTWYENSGTATPTFTANVITSSADGAWSSFAIDMDGDGDMDVLSASIWDDKVAWYENDGAATPGWTEHLIGTADGVRTVVAGDIDADGDIDVATASFVDDRIAWFENDGSATPSFTRNTVSTNALGAMSIEIVDVNGDGHLDLVSASYADGKIAWFRSDGAADPVFSETVISTSAIGARDITTADLDGDGDMDIISASFIDDKFAWYENDGAASPVFVERLVSQDSDGPRAVAIADMDGDGDLDVVGASLNDDEVGFFENTDGRMGLQSLFEDASLVFDAANGNQIWVSDVDANGMDIQVRLEIANGTMSLSGSHGLTFNVGSGTADSIMEFRGSVDDINAALDGMTFTPTPDFVGVASVRIITNDLGNSGSGGALVDDDTVNITVSALNDAPVLTPASPALPTINEDDIANGGRQVGLLLGASVTDVDAGAIEGIAITSLSSGNGTWQYSLDGGASWLDVGAVTNNSALLLRSTDFLRFVPDAQNADAASITYRAWDQTSGSAGALADTSTNGNQSPFSAATDSASITVTAVNDAPVLDPAAALSLGPVLEDDTNPPGDTVATILASAPGDPLTDVDAGALEGIAVTAVDNSNGAWQYSIDGGASWLDFGAVSTNNAVLLDNTAVVRFVPDAGYIGSGGSVTFHGWDRSTGLTGQTGVDASITGGSSAFSTLAASFTIAVAPVNDTPTTSGIAPVAVDEDAAPTIIDLHAAFDDLEDADAALTYTVTGNTNSALFDSLVVDAAGGTLTLAYLPNANGSALVTVRATDTSGAFVETDITVNVSAVNDAPTTSGIANIAGSEDGAPLSIDLLTLFDDIEDGAGALTFNVTGNSNPALATAAVNAADGTATFTPIADSNGTTTLTIRATDTAGAIVEATFNLTLAAVNDAPTALGLPAVTVNEDAPILTLDLSAAFADIDDLPAALSYTLVGTSGDPVLGATVDAAAGTLSLQFLEDQNGDATVTVRAIDASGAFADVDVRVTVTPVDDAPLAIVPAGQSTNQNSVVLFSSGQGNAIRISDPDGGQVTVTLSTSDGGLFLANTAGLVFANGSGGNGATLTFTGSVDAVNAALDGLQFQPSQNFAGITTISVSTQTAGAAQSPSVARFGVIVLDAAGADDILAKAPQDTVQTTKPATPRATQTDDDALSEAPVFDAPPPPQSDLALTSVGGLPAFQGATVLHVLNTLVESVERDDTAQGGTGETDLASVTRRLLALGAGNSSSALLVNDAVFDALDLLKKSFDQSGETALAESEMVVAVATGVTLSLSAGFVTWIMRAGALLTSLLSTTPVWRGFDPLPILGTARDHEDDFYLEVPDRNSKAEKLFDDVSGDSP